MSGKKPTPQRIMASVLQGSILRPLLWNVYINGFLYLIPQAKAFADDITLSDSYHLEDEATAVPRVNGRLDDIVAWGKRWKVAFVPHKSQLMLVSWTRAHVHLTFSSRQLGTKDEMMEILGVTFNTKMIFKRHIK